MKYFGYAIIGLVIFFVVIFVSINYAGSIGAGFNNEVTIVSAIAILCSIIVICTLIINESINKLNK